MEMKELDLKTAKRFIDALLGIKRLEEEGFEMDGSYYLGLKSKFTEKNFLSKCSFEVGLNYPSVFKMKPESVILSVNGKKEPVWKLNYTEGLRGRLW